MELSSEEKEELKRLLFVAMQFEANMMNLAGVENAIFLVKKLQQSAETPS